MAAPAASLLHPTSYVPSFVLNPVRTALNGALSVSLQNIRSNPDLAIIDSTAHLALVFIATTFVKAAIPLLGMVSDAVAATALVAVATIVYKAIESMEFLNRPPLRPIPEGAYEVAGNTEGREVDETAPSGRHRRTAAAAEEGVHSKRAWLE